VFCESFMGLVCLFSNNLILFYQRFLLRHWSLTIV
jgi:hypothetical protein